MLQIIFTIDTDRYRYHRYHFDDNRIDHHFSFCAFVVSYHGSVANYARCVFALEASSCSLAASKQSKKICCRFERSAGFHSRRSRVGTLHCAPCLGGNASQSCETNEQKLWDCSNIFFSQTLCAHNENTYIVLLPTLHFSH